MKNIQVIKFCPNLRILFTGLKNNWLETLKMLFNNFQYLEKVKICCYGIFNEKDIFEIVVKYSPKNFNELELYYSDDSRSELLPEELESSYTTKITFFDYL